jgi:hypothetical protein
MSPFSLSHKKMSETITEGETKYSYYCGADKIPCPKCKNECPWPNLSVAEQTSFTLMTVGNIDKDDDCDVWTMNDAKMLKNVEIDP